MASTFFGSVLRNVEQKVLHNLDQKVDFLLNLLRGVSILVCFLCQKVIQIWWPNWRHGINHFGVWPLPLVLFLITFFYFSDAILAIHHWVWFS